MTILAPLALAILAVWRLPAALALPQGAAPWTGYVLGPVWLAALFLLFRHALGCENARLKGVSCGVGLLFALFSMVGTRLRQAGAFAVPDLGMILDGLVSLTLLTLTFAAALLLACQGAEAVQKRRAQASGKESLFSRILGNGFAVFALLMLCWLPVWLAFWPGTLVHDAVNQFYTYLDWAHTTHHPLLHTLLLGSLIMLGIDSTAEGSSAAGLAIYSVVQMALLAAMLAYACHWLRRRGAPLWARLGVTLLFALFPFYSLWSFSAQKDVLFGGLCLLFSLELADLWRDGPAAFRPPLRLIRFVLVAALMMLMRHNGVYALCLALPLLLIWAKGVRVKTGALLAGCLAVYMLANAGLVRMTEAEPSSRIEMLSIPLQQIGRTLRDNPEAWEADSQGVLEAIYGTNPAEYYAPDVADPMKWAADNDAVAEEMGPLLSLWLRLAPGNLKAYLEAFFVQNLPYYLPGAEMRYRLDLGIIQIELFPMEPHSYFPALKALYEDYDRTLTLWGLPGVRLLSDSAFHVWLCLAGVGLAVYRRQKQWLAAFAFLLGIWVTCLVGPVAIMRYLLGISYAAPVLLAAMLAPAGFTNAPERGMMEPSNQSLEDA